MSENVAKPEEVPAAAEVKETAEEPKQEEPKIENLTLEQKPEEKPSEVSTVESSTTETQTPATEAAQSDEKSEVSEPAKAEEVTTPDKPAA